MLEFNPDGSMKLTDKQVMQKEAEEQSVIITREQISVKPAKAQIRIKFPEEGKVDNLISFYGKIEEGQFRSVEHSIEKIDEKTFIVKINKGSMLMYGLLNYLIGCFRSKLINSNCGKIIVKGSWANYGNEYQS